MDARNCTTTRGTDRDRGNLISCLKLEVNIWLMNRYHIDFLYIDRNTIGIHAVLLFRMKYSPPLSALYTPYSPLTGRISQITPFTQLTQF